MYNQVYLTFTDSTVWPHSVFMCFMLISGETAIISLHSLHWLVVTSKMECVYCVVWAECWSIFQFNISFV